MIKKVMGILVLASMAIVPAAYAEMKNCGARSRTCDPRK